MSTRRRSGFSLVEVLVAVLLFSFVLILLFRGLEAVMTTVSLGERRSELDRRLAAARRVMAEDVRALRVHPRRPVHVGEGDGGPAFAFLRHRAETGDGTETEWVQYWREPHPEVERLRTWVRYAAPATNRHDLARTDWWNAVTRSNLTGEVVLDHLVDARVEVHTRSDSVTNGEVATRAVEAVDLRLACTVPPLAVGVGTPSPAFLERNREEDGAWIEFRVRPAALTPPPEATP